MGTDMCMCVSDMHTHRILLCCVGTHGSDAYKSRIWGTPNLIGHTVGILSGKRISEVRTCSEQG